VLAGPTRHAAILSREDAYRFRRSIDRRQVQYPERLSPILELCVVGFNGFAPPSRPTASDQYLTRGPAAGQSPPRFPSPRPRGAKLSRGRRTMQRKAGFVGLNPYNAGSDRSPCRRCRQSSSISTFLSIARGGRWRGPSAEIAPPMSRAAFFLRYAGRSPIVTGNLDRISVCPLSEPATRAQSQRRGHSRDLSSVPTILARSTPRTCIERALATTITTRRSSAPAHQLPSSAR